MAVLTKVSGKTLDDTEIADLLLDDTKIELWLDFASDIAVTQTDLLIKRANEVLVELGESVTVTGVEYSGDYVFNWTFA